MKLEQIIGRNIKYWRGIRRMSLTTLSTKTQIPKDELKSFEMGLERPKPEHLLKLCENLNVHIRELLNEK
ncbi:helix-turn-helix domain-containing protein [Acetobacter sicerae]|uniref:helix-turn-helix domain-containing protein n=1 Tax=Acetobacter sicerae TaxID=85325 RepID=UPI00156AA1ED|nr:helix-turn-helix transcriptional regulator [Acetobacter sicerae]NHN93779.1 helix-turn-helix domain-containing protein [Acetobacter sicerae]